MRSVRRILHPWGRELRFPQGISRGVRLLLGVLSRIRSKPLNSKHFAPPPARGTEDTGENPKGTAPMQIGCKPDANAPALDGIPSALRRAWPNVPEHIQLAILALIEPYRPSATGND